MDETTTTSTTDSQGVASTTQPNEAVTTEAVTTQPQPTQPPAQVDETAEWILKKGLDRQDPEYLDKLEKMAYNSEKLMTKATQEASALKNAMDRPAQPISGSNNVDPLLSGMADFISDYNRDKMISGFKESHADWKQYDGAMGEILTQKVNTAYGTFTRSQLVNEGILNLEDIYVMAKGATPVDTNAIKDDARSEVLQTLANTQRAGGGTPNASNPIPQTTKADPILDAIRKSRGE